MKSGRPGSFVLDGTELLTIGQEGQITVDNNWSNILTDSGVMDYGVLGSAVSFPSRVCGKAPATKSFCALYCSENSYKSMVY